MQHHSNTMTLSGASLFSIRLVIQVFVVFFLMSFLGLLRQWEGGLVQYASQDQTLVDGIVLSMKPERFNHTRQVLAQMGISAVQKTPPSYQSQEVSQSLESFLGSRHMHNPTNLKVWSNQMAFVDAMEAFVVESKVSRTPNRWRFFFEDDLAMNPNITSEHAKVLLAKGLEIGAEDGFVYLGLCGPICEGSRVLDKHVEAARCAGACAHAFGFQARTAATFLQLMSEVKVESTHKRLYMDQVLRAYGRQVKKAWVLGSNLKSPADRDHIGIVYQDRILFPTTIG